MSFSFSLFDIFWIFLILVSIQPFIRQRIVNGARMRAIRQVEKKRGSRVIVLIQRQETMSFLGFPLTRYIDVNDSERVLRAIKLTDPGIPVDLVLHTPGGLVLAAEQIAMALCRRKAPVTVFIPHYAMSGGTLIAMAADQIVMDENAVLGPVDPQLGGYPAASIVQVLERKSINEIDDQTLILADIARKAQDQVRETISQILTSKNKPGDQANAIAEILSSGRWTHDYPISVDEARNLNLPVSTDLPKEIYQLMDLYPQASQRRPSVEYIPVPYPPAAPSPGDHDRRPK